MFLSHPPPLFSPPLLLLPPRLTHLLVVPKKSTSFCSLPLSRRHKAVSPAGMYTVNRGMEPFQTYGTIAFLSVRTQDRVEKQTIETKVGARKEKEQMLRFEFYIL